MIEGLTVDQAAVAGLVVVGVSTLLFLRRIDSKVEGAASKEALGALQEDVNGIGSKVNDLSDRLTRTSALLEAQTHRIDEHAQRNAEVARNYRELADDLAAEIRALNKERGR